VHRAAADRASVWMRSAGAPIGRPSARLLHERSVVGLEGLDELPFEKCREIRQRDLLGMMLRFEDDSCVLAAVQPVEQHECLAGRQSNRHGAVVGFHP
jgi:hypothetical protein